MARAKLDEAVIFEIKSYRSQKVRRGERLIPTPLDTIEQKMNEARDAGIVTSDMPGRGSIQKYAREFDDLPSDIRTLNEPFAWNRINEYPDLPWEAGGFLLRMYKFVNHTIRQQTITVYDPPPPTYREALWWWRVHLTDIEGRLDDQSVWVIAHLIMYRQLKHEFLGVPLYLEDVEAYLAFSPWIEGNEAEYESAIIQGLIPGMEYEGLYSDAPEGSDNPDFLRAVRWLVDSPIGRPSMELREFWNWDDTQKK